MTGGLKPPVFFRPDMVGIIGGQPDMIKLKHLFDANQEWAAGITEQDPQFFTNLSKQQAPEYLWIGCSDSRVPANQIIGLDPGEVFVHRNIANLVVHTDLNCLSVIHFAVEVLEVKHIIVCGHYGCGGIKAAMDTDQHGLIDYWLLHINDVRRLNEDKLAGLNQEQKIDLLCELNVQEQVANVCETSIVQNAWKRGADLSVHGWIYDIKNGILKDLDTCITSEEQLKKHLKND
jgi:carbonic anhydrase